MSYKPQKLLVCVDRHRRGRNVRENVMRVATKLQTPLRIIYIIDIRDLSLFMPEPFVGTMIRQID